MEVTLDSSIDALPGIGKVRAEKFNALNIRTISDLLLYYPRSYEDRSEIYEIKKAQVDEFVCIRAVVGRMPSTSYVRQGMTLTRTTVFDDSSSLSVIWFNQPYSARKLQLGFTYIFWGRIQEKNGHKSMTNPIVEEEGKQSFTGKIVPIYPLTQGLTGKVLYSVVRAAMPYVEGIENRLPESVRLTNHIPERKWAIRQLHQPDNFESLELAKKSLAFEELFYFTLSLEILKAQRIDIRGCRCFKGTAEEYLKLLPYCLTNAQRRALNECFSDMASGYQMNRLVQGDVGSGKTVVAAGAIWLAFKNGWQSALMAPTEILATQHYHSLCALLEASGMRIALLTGSTKSKDKQDILDKLQNGALDLIIGTHALISKNVKYKELGLIIVDEQHRFGVGQRSNLADKSDNRNPHVLVLSATPIPRTLALILYGDLNISIIDERPPGRQTVDTFLVNSGKRNRLNSFTRKQVEEGHQVYIICPMIDDSDSVIDLGLKSAVTYGKKLKTEIFPDLRVEILHGKLKPNEKDSIMNRFFKGEIDILVSTTVIEVGVDAPNASLIIIENADRFGLSQLHQLRGRVGRGSEKAYCVLVSDNRNPESRARLKALCDTNDGFKIADKDLELRGPGDFFGDRQHGLPQLKAANLLTDTSLLYHAKKAALDLLAEDPKLENNSNVKVWANIRSIFQDSPNIFN